MVEVKVISRLQTHRARELQHERSLKTTFFESKVVSTHSFICTRSHKRVANRLNIGRSYTHLVLGLSENRTSKYASLH